MRIGKPRPNPTAPTQPNNGVFGWWKNRQAKKKEEEEEAAIAIIDKATENENTFCNLLGGIDFKNSKLAPEHLNARSKENTSSYGDLEHMAKYISQEIRRNAYSVSIDVRPLDKVLYQIIKRYKEAIENGYPNQAFAARVALNRAFTKIRFRLPQVLPEGSEKEYAREYIGACAKHAQSWLTLIVQARMADQLDENVRNQKIEHDNLVKQSAERKDAALKAARSDPAKEQAMRSILMGTPFSELSPLAKDLFADSVELRIDDINIDLAKRQLQQNQINAKNAKGRITTLKISLSNMNLPVDPNAMNKYNDEINEMLTRMAKMDQEIEESIAAFEDLKHKVEAMDDLPGAQAAREFAAKGIQDLFEQKAAEQNAKLARSHGFANLFEMFDVKTEEEMEQALAEQEILAQDEEFLYEEMDETEDQLNFAD